jgi:hypothetical protein
MLGVRDALMAEHLLAIRARERPRGATLVFAHNRHLQRHPSTWRLAGMDLEWFSAGAIVATLLGDRYAFIAGSLGASATLGLRAPDADTFEGVMQEATRGNALFDPARVAAAGALHVRTDGTAEQGYFPLDAATLAHCDAVLHVSGAPGSPPAVAVPDAAPAPAEPAVPDAAPAPAELAARIRALPGVTCVLADEASGAPESSWGDRFFFVGTDRRMPFATIVERDTPDWDEASRLDRPGVFRLNAGIGREAFAREFGYPPAGFATHQSAIDFGRLDEVLPHPVYAPQGWACILNPSARRLPDVDRLIAEAHRQAVSRQRRAGPAREG